MVTIEPWDLTSATANTPVTFWVDYGDRPVPDHVLTALRSTIRLERYPGAEPVEYGVQEQPSGIPDTVVQTSNPYRAALLVTPTSPLGDGWYRASFDAAAAGVDPNRTLNPRGPDGRNASRFNPAHAPVLQSVTFCSDGGSIEKVVVGFSEPLEISSADALEARNSSGTLCQQHFSVGDVVPTFGFACPAVAASSPTASVSLGTTLTSVDGQLAGILGGDPSELGKIVLAPTTLLVDWSTAIQSESLCKRWVP